MPSSSCSENDENSLKSFSVPATSISKDGTEWDNLKLDQSSTERNSIQNVVSLRPDQNSYSMVRVNSNSALSAFRISLSAFRIFLMKQL